MLNIVEGFKSKGLLKLRMKTKATGGPGNLVLIGLAMNASGRVWVFRYVKDSDDFKISYIVRGLKLAREKARALAVLYSKNGYEVDLNSELLPNEE